MVKELKIRETGILLLLVLSAIVLAKHVNCPSGLPVKFSPIQDTINTAQEGATIRVPRNIYFGVLKINKTLTLIGDNAIIDANGQQAGILILAPNVILSGFTVQNVIRFPDAFGVPPEISELDLEMDGSGIYVYQTRGTQIENCSVTNCFMGVGIFQTVTVSLKTLNIYNTTWQVMLSYSTDVQIFGSTIKDNFVREGGAAGIWIGQHSLMTLRNCTIENNMWGLIFQPETTYNKVQYNNFLNNTYNVYVHPVALWVGEFPNNYWSDYQGIDADGDGLGDTPYRINAYNADPHPMMVDPPYTPPPKYEYQAGGGCPGKVPNPK